MSNSKEITEKLGDLFKKKLYDEVIDLGENFINSNPDHLDAHNILAITYKVTGNRDKAEEIFFKIIKRNPKNPKIGFIYSNCANLFYDLGKTEKAIVFHKASLELDPGNLASSVGIVLALSTAGKDKDAIEFSKLGLEKHKDNAGLNLVLAQTYRKLSKYKEAIYHYSKSNSRLSKSYKLECLYISMKSETDKEIFHDFLDELMDSDLSDPLSSSISTHSAIRFSREDKSNFCKQPFDLIKKYSLFDKPDFNEDFIDEFLFDINRSGINKKAQALINNGLQTSGNLFNLQYDSVKKMRSILIENMHEYRNYYRNREGNFIKSWPKEGSLFGWLISLKKGGNLDSHNHKEGWLSSSVYLKMPQKKNDEGNIKFSLNGAKYETDGVKYPEKIIDISVGDMIMFPSSIFHSTIPFSSNEFRITLAFDLTPRDFVST